MTDTPERRLADGFKAKVKLVTPEIASEEARLPILRRQPSVVTTNFSEAEIKLGEAQFFLTLLEENAPHQAIMYYSLSAFLSAARSVTFFLQVEGKDREGFATWYEEVRKRLVDDEIAKYLKEQRDVSVHAGYSAIRTVFDLPLFKTSDGWIIRPEEGIHVGFSFDEYVTENGLPKCRAHLELLTEIVGEARTRGFLPDTTARRVSMEFRDEGKERKFAPPASRKGDS